MIIWLNGPFGVGKSTLARAVVSQMPGTMIMDPEVIGAYLHRLVPSAPTGDYQDLEIWRSMTAHTILEMQRIYEVPVIVPMTLVKPGYIEDIHGKILGHDVSLLHYFLDASVAVLRDRIQNHEADDNDPIIDSGVRNWRLTHLQRCLDARATMPESTIWLDTTTCGPADLARRIQKDAARFQRPA